MQLIQKAYFKLAHLECSTRFGHVVQAKLLEHNVRFGDPECQGLMLRLESDLLEVLLAACDGQLADVQLKWSPDAALTVVMAAEGYPGSYKKGTMIRNLEHVSTAKVSFACVHCQKSARFMVVFSNPSSIEQRGQQFAMLACPLVIPSYRMVH